MRCTGKINRKFVFMSLTNLRSPAQWFKDFVHGITSSGGDGKTVTAEAALSYAPVWYGVTKISGHVAQLPIGVFKRVDGGGERDRQHELAKLLRKPNAYQTSSVFREQVSNHSLLEGNGRAAIVKSGSKIVELIPLDPACTATGMVAGEKIHATRPGKDNRLRQFFPDVNGEDVTEGGSNVIMLLDSEVLHISGLSMNGIDGIPLREIARRNLNAAINTERRISKQAEQGFSGSLMLQAPEGVFRKQEDAEKFLDAFNEKHGSPEKAGKAGMLRDGMTANILQSSNRDSEMTDNRKFQRQDAALWLGLEQILGDDSSVSYNSLEQKNLAYLMNCLNRWLKRWEEEIERKLLPTRQFDNDTHYVRYNTAALLKSDYKTSIESLSQALQSTIINRNEARQKLDMLPVEGGETFANPAITPGDSGEPAATTTEPASSGGDTAVSARLEHLIGVECKRVQQAAKKAVENDKNFLEWVDAFYDDKWTPKLADWCEDLGLDRDAAAVHTADSKARLLDVVDMSTNETLESNLTKALTSWPSRAAAITRTGSDV